MTRNGKIARLPYSLREELNLRLEQSEESPTLLEWLNALPEVKEVLAAHFAGVPISKQNLSEWRQGGFQEWLLRRSLLGDVHDTREVAEQIDDDEDSPELVDDVATLLSARYAALICNWNGEVDEKFEAKARILNGLTRSVVQLQRGAHRAKRESIETERMMEEQEERAEEALKHKAINRITRMFKARASAFAYGGGAAGEKIATYVLAIQNGEFNARLDLTDDDTYANDTGSKTVKQSRRKPEARVKQSKPQPKSMKNNGLQVEAPAQSVPCPSDSVVVGKTTLSPVEQSPSDPGAQIPPEKTKGETPGRPI